jgi:hypothetical protein
MEEYRIINNFENYEVSNLGNVRNIKTKKILKTDIKNGYKYITLMKDLKNCKNYNHRLVALTFIDNPENKLHVDHIDNDRLNNNVINLRFATSQENNRNSLISSRNTSGYKGVSFHKKTQKWWARIMIDGIEISLGLFNNIEEARQARIIKANAAFGIFVNACEKLD